MINKNVLLAVGASVAFTSCFCATELNLNDEFLKKTNGILNAPMERVEFGFKTDGRQGSEEYWLMTREQFNSLKELLEYAVVGPRVVWPENEPENKRFTFVGNDLGFERNNHYCCVGKASFFQKIILCVKTKSITPFTKDPYVHVANDSYTHVVIKCDVKINPFEVVTKGSRLYPNVPGCSKIGNLPGIYLRGDGKTKKTGNLIGFSYMAAKCNTADIDENARNYFFGQLWIDRENS